MLTTGRRRSEESQAAGGEALGPNFRYTQDVNGRLIQWCVALDVPPLTPPLQQNPHPDRALQVQ
jgi:hypothetical protein